MADPGQLARLKSDVKVWNQWRLDHPDERIDLEGAELSHAYLWEANLSGAALAGANLSETLLAKTDLKGANLRGANLAGAQLLATILEDADLTGVNFTKVAFWRATLFQQNLAGANFTDANMFKTMLAGSNLKGAIFERTNLKEANIIGADLTGARLCGADLSEANLAEAVLSQADLTSANLFEANLTEADFSGATLVGANLQAALCVNTIFDDADLSGCRVYGLSAWDLRLKGATQHDLVITPDGMADVAVGNLGVAQFLYLLLSNPSIRDVVDTITSKVVLILGRFTSDRKAVLDRLRAILRAKGYSPVPRVEFSVARRGTTMCGRSKRCREAAAGPLLARITTSPALPTAAWRFKWATAHPIRSARELVRILNVQPQYLKSVKTANCRAP